MTYFFNLQYHEYFKTFSYIYTTPFCVFLFGTFGNIRNYCGDLYIVVLLQIICTVLVIIGLVIYSKYEK